MIYLPVRLNSGTIRVPVEILDRRSVCGRKECLIRGLSDNPEHAGTAWVYASKIEEKP